MVIEYFGDDVEVFMFDGVMVNKCFCEEVCIDDYIYNFNFLLEDRYNGLVEFMWKLMDSDIDLYDFVISNVLEEYDVVKKRFEEKYFYIL